MSTRLLVPAVLFACCLAAVPGPEASAQPSCPESKSRLVQRTYQVADLVVPLNSSAAPALVPTCIDSPFLSVSSTARTTAGTSTQQELIELITSTVAPKSWAAKGGQGTIDYFPLGMSLVINQTPDVQEQIVDLLQTLRRLQDIEVAVEVRVLVVGDDYCQRLGVGIDADAKEPGKPNVTFLNDKQFSALMEASRGDARTSVMQMPKLTMFNGQIATFQCLESQHYLTGVEAKWNGDRVLTLPKNEAFETGLKLSLQPAVSADNHHVRLRLTGKLTSLVSDPVPLSPVASTIQPEAGGASDGQPVLFTQFIQLPRFFTLNVDKTLVIADGGTALLSGWKRQRDTHAEHAVPVLSDLPFLGELFKNVEHGHITEQVMLLVTPRIIINEEEEIIKTGVISKPALVQDCAAVHPGEACTPEPCAEEARPAGVKTMPHAQ